MLYKSNEAVLTAQEGRFEMSCTLGTYVCIHTGCLQKSGAVSKINKKFISHLTRAKRRPTPSAAATVQVSHALPAQHKHMDEF